MPTPKDRRTTTLSISLTSELAAAVAARVESGLYTSASELVREALRLLFESERRPATADAVRESPADRFRRVLELRDFGASLRAAPADDDAAARTAERRRALDEAMESDHEIRPAADRLRKLRRDGSG